MQSTPALQLSAAVNGQFPFNRFTNFSAAVVVINSLPFRGRIDRLPPIQLHWRTPAGTPEDRALPSLRFSKVGRVHYPREASRMSTAKLRVL